MKDKILILDNEESQVQPLLAALHSVGLRPGEHWIYWKDLDQAGNWLDQVTDFPVAIVADHDMGSTVESGAMFLARAFVAAEGQGVGLWKILISGRSPRTISRAEQLQVHFTYRKSEEPWALRLALDLSTLFADGLKSDGRPFSPAEAVPLRDRIFVYCNEKAETSKQEAEWRWLALPPRFEESCPAKKSRPVFMYRGAYHHMLEAPNAEWLGETLLRWRVLLEGEAASYKLVGRKDANRLLDKNVLADEDYDHVTAETRKNRFIDLRNDQWLVRLAAHFGVDLKEMAAWGGEKVAAGRGGGWKPDTLFLPCPQEFSSSPLMFLKRMHFFLDGQRREGFEAWRCRTTDTAAPTPQERRSAASSSRRR